MGRIETPNQLISFLNASTQAAGGLVDEIQGEEGGVVAPRFDQRPEHGLERGRCCPHHPRQLDHRGHSQAVRFVELAPGRLLARGPDVHGVEPHVGQLDESVHGRPVDADGEEGLAVDAEPVRCRRDVGAGDRPPAEGDGQERQRREKRPGRAGDPIR